MWRDRRRKRVVLVPEGLPNCGERNVFVSIGDRIARSATGNDMPAYPVIDPISCGGEVAHRPIPSLRSFLGSLHRHVHCFAPCARAIVDDRTLTNETRFRFNFPFSL